MNRPYRYLNKTYWRIGPFEFQYGHIGHSLGFWFRQHWYTILPGRYRALMQSVVSQREREARREQGMEMALSEALAIVERVWHDCEEQEKPEQQDEGDEDDDG